MANYTTNVNENVALTMNYTGTVDVVTIAKDGLYKLEVWGAQGGGGAKGGHSIGYKEFKKGDKIYVCIGGQGTVKGGADAPGGYNGGGRGCAYRYSGGISGTGVGRSGGGCTHIASVSGTLASIGAGNKSKVFIVAGGAGGGNASSSGNAGKSTGGGTNGGNGNEGYYIVATGGTQTAGGISDSYQSGGARGTFGQGVNMSPAFHNYNTQGGGGGLYGGGGNHESQGGSGYGMAGGGSGYIGGVPSITYKGTKYTPTTQNGVRSGNGMAQITFVKKGTPAMYWGDEEIDAIYYGDTEIDAACFGDLELN